VIFDHLQKSFSYKEVQFKTFCSPVETSRSPAENADKSHTILLPTGFNMHSYLILNWTLFVMKTNLVIKPKLNYF